MKTFLVLLLAFTAWAQPIHAASALLTESKIEDPIFINYEQFHKITSDEPRRTNRILSSTQLSNGSSESYSGRHYSKEEVQQLIKDYSAIYRINSDTPLAIARCESGFQQFAANKSSSARSIYQYLAGTWANTPEGRQGISVFDADAHVRAAVRHIATHGTAPWNASKHCWNR